jgi:ABC-2 type transport system ATP-binding protein
MSAPADHAVRFEDVSKFYGEVLGVAGVHLVLEPGIVALVGPNGAGKSTFMNLMAGLLQPTTGRVSVRGATPDDPVALHRVLGYCPQYDSFPRGLSGQAFLEGQLGLHGFAGRAARAKAGAALERVGLAEAARRRVAGYSKGMRQRLKLAQAIAHEPRVLLLDEPLNGLDPLGRSEMIALFREFAGGGRHVIISSHILHEVDFLSERVVLIKGGRILAEGDIGQVRSEIATRPLQIAVRTRDAGRLAARIFEQDAVVEARIHEDGSGLTASTRDPDGFYLLVNRLVVDEGFDVEAIAPADEDVRAVYRYLIGGEEES